MEIMTHVGVFAVEQRYEQRIVVSLDLMVVDSYDGVSDRLRDILDYGEIAKGVQSVVQAGHVNLIETLAERIANYCLSFATVQSARVRIEKPDTLTGIRRVGIEIERVRPAD
jgi:dihydroneopterin aldolase